MDNNNLKKQNEISLEASFSSLVMSLGSHALISLGLASDPNDSEKKIDFVMAKFNIDLLIVLKEKTKNNLNKEEQNFLDSLIRDLQVKYVNLKKD